MHIALVLYCKGLIDSVRMLPTVSAELGHTKIEFLAQDKVVSVGVA